MTRFAATLAGVLLSFLLAGCSASWNNRGGLTDQLVDDFWWKADSKEMRALRAYTIQASLLRVGARGTGSSRQRQVLGFKNWLATEAFNELMQCIWTEGSLSKGMDVRMISVAPRDRLEPEPLKFCPFFDTRMRNYEDALHELSRAALAFEEESTLFQGLLDGNANIVFSLLKIGEAAIRTGRAAAPLYRDAIELEMLVWGDTYPDIAAIHADGRDDLRRWRATLEEAKARLAPPRVGVRHFAYVSDLILSTCRDLGEEGRKSDCAISLRFVEVPASMKRRRS